MGSSDGSDGQDGQSKRRGRPPVTASQKRDQNITFRTNNEIKNKLENSASLNGRTVSQEIEFILKVYLYHEEMTEGSSPEMFDDVISEASKAKIHQTNLLATKMIEDAKIIAMNKTKEMISIAEDAAKLAKHHMDFDRIATKLDELERKVASALPSKEID